MHSVLQIKTWQQLLRSWWLAGFLLGVGSLGLVGVFMRQPKTRPVREGSSKLVQQAPSETKPDNKSVDTYSVAADAPKYIAIPRIGLDKTRVRGLGLLQNQQIAAPENIYDAGWYRGSAKPGQSGTIFVYGHLSSWTAKGAFYNLHKLKAGDQVAITRGDNQTFTYEVQKTVIYPANKIDMRAVLMSSGSGPQNLSLMTCAGKVIKGTNEFDQRLVVFAHRIK